MQQCKDLRKAEGTDKFDLQEKKFGVKLDKTEWLTAVIWFP